jgi:hypothetical protein
MSAPARDIFLKKVPEEVGANTFFRRVPEEKTRNISVLLVAGVSAAVHGVLGVIFAPLFAVAFMAVKTPQHAVLSGGIDGATLAALFPLLYAAVGFVVGAAAAGVYNSLAKHMFHPEPVVEEQPQGLEIALEQSA